MNTGLREKRGFYKEPRCPFCDRPIDIPRTIRADLGEFTGGNCECGAVYTCDPTGHNIGEALLDALIYACDNEWERFNEISSEDYNEVILNYEINTHRLWNISDIRREGGGKIIFIKIKKEN